MKKENIFENFTHQYSLSKTLRFELIPTEETKRFLEKNEIIKKDAVIDESYHKAKPYFDSLHREFIKESLDPERSLLSFGNFERSWNDFQKDKKSNKKNLLAQKKLLYKDIAKLFDDYVNTWKKQYAPETKNSGTKLLYSADTLSILKKRFPKDSENEKLFIKDEHGNDRYIFDSFDRFTTYLTKFQATRENLYKNDGTSTAVATRIVENLSFFLANKSKFEKFLAYKDILKLTDQEKESSKTEYYMRCMTQPGIEKYNALVGDLNARMKTLRDTAGKDAKKSDYPLLKKLYNQILAEKKIESDKVFDIESNEEVPVRMHEFYEEVERVSTIAKELVTILAQGGFENEYGGIYLHNRAINTIARKWFVSAYEFENCLPQKGKKKEGSVRVAPFVSFAEIKDALGEKLAEDLLKEKLFEEKAYRLVKRTLAYSQFLALFAKDLEILLNEYNEKKNNFSKKDLRIFERGENDENVDALKDALDAGLHIVQFMKYFVLSSKKADDKPTHTSAEFYNHYDELYGDPDQKHDIVRYYDAFRNFLTKKPADQKKIKLNFENGALLTGFDKDKESEKLGIILRKNSIYYLGIINKEHNKIFDDKKHQDAFDVVDATSYEKMEYKLFPDPKRMVPKIAFAKKNRERFGWTQEIQDIKDEYARFQDDRGDRSNWSKQFDKIKLTKLIAYYQHALDRGGYKNTFDFQWNNPVDYSGIGEFNDHLTSQNYKIGFRQVRQRYIDDKVAQGELYLFKIHNKDFGEKSKGTQNTHTLYFLNLFSQHNLTHIKLRLAGNAEVFYRKSSTQRKEEQRKFIRPIVKNKRFTEDKYFFHIPIKIGASVNSISETKFNRTLNEKLRQSACLIIGIDRGEKHLAYYSVINQKGEIVDQASLNKINDVDYCEKLRTREKERLEQRKSWKAISQIKDLKRGYISQVIHKLSELVIKHNAIIVFEDLNMRFKEVRGGIERSAYQQLEKALIEKFGYLVFKDKGPLEAGGVLNGYQLSAPFESFEKMGKQNGVIFYTNPEYTSTTDPVTGWRQHIYIKSDATDNEALKVFTEKIGIGWSDDKQSYTFSYDQKDFWGDSPARKWVLYANAPRLERYRNDAGYWTTRETNSNDLLRELFEVWDFDQPEGDISEQIAMMYEEGKLKGEKIISEKSQRFFKALRYALNLTQQIRNSDSIRYVYERDAQGDIVEDSQGKMVVKEIGENVDFIASPVVPFFTTPNPYTKENLCGLVIENGDANGAYNIARKGIMMLERIKQTQANPDLYISKSDWDEWLMKDIKQK